MSDAKDVERNIDTDRLCGYLVGVSVDGLLIEGVELSCLGNVSNAKVHHELPKRTLSHLI